MLINGIMIPISAYLTSKYSTRRLFNTALILFMIGSWHLFYRIQERNSTTTITIKSKMKRHAGGMSFHIYIQISR